MKKEIEEQNLPKPENSGEASIEAGKNELSRPINEPLPRPVRRRRRSKADRGLPDDAEIVRLAEAYLTESCRVYLAGKASGVIPKPSEDLLIEMVQDFKDRHRGGPVSPSAIRDQLKAIGISKAGGGYFRFSCDNSSATSIIDQMVNCLRKAASDGRFIPWKYTYADYAVTGLDASRQGYTSYKKILSAEEQLVDTTYIDDFSRASRDEVEWWRLASLSKRFKKRFIGASDNFDLTSQNGEIMVSMFGIFCRLLLKSLREKVGRGMKGAARRGTCLGKQQLGFTRRQKLDPSGNPLMGADGKPIYEPCEGPTTSDYRRLIYELYVQKNWSRGKIAKYFSQLKVDGWEGWTSAAIKKLLWSEKSIGVFIWNKTHSEYEFEEDRLVYVRNPRSEWEVYYSRELAIVPMDDWRAARRKIVAERSPQLGKKRSRNEKHPTTLFSGTLFCDCCEHNELKLIRSTDKHKQMGSVNGVAGAHGCRLSTSKSTRVIEQCLLDYIRNHLLTPEVVTGLMDKANSFLEEEAQKPIPETSNAKRRIKQAKQEIERLIRRSAKTEDDVVAARYHAEIERLSKEMRDDQSVVMAAAAAERRKLQRIDISTALKQLTDLRCVLNEDVAIAGPAIRNLTGPILIRQEELPGRKGMFRWVACFTPQVAKLVQKLAPSEIGDIASSSIPPVNSVEVIIEKVPDYERMAPEFKRLKDGGASAEAIAAMYKLYPTTVHQAIRFAETGERPDWGPKRKNKGTGGQKMRYKEIANDVVRMIDKERMKIPEVAEELRVCERTVKRAYDHLRPEAVQIAVTTGTRTRRRTPTRLSHEVFKKIGEMAGSGASTDQIAEAAGCSANTVRRELKRLREKGEPASHRKRKSA